MNEQGWPGITDAASASGRRRAHGGDSLATSPKSVHAAIRILRAETHARARPGRAKGDTIALDP